jgi:hypothetical protein
MILRIMADITAHITGIDTGAAVTTVTTGEVITVAVITDMATGIGVTEGGEFKIIYRLP